MNTEDGRKQYLLNIQQIAQSVQETNNYDVLSAVLNCNDYEREWEKRHSIIRSPWTEIGRREIMEFAIVQKDPRGFEILHEKYKKRLQRYGVSPNMWIFPPGLALYAAFNPVVSDYNKEAAGVTLNTSAEALGSFRGVNVFETREFDVRNGELPINLLQRRVQVGECYYMRPHGDQPSAFNSETSLSTYLYDERKDDFLKVSYGDALQHAISATFDGEDPEEMFPTPHDCLFTYKVSDFNDDDDHAPCRYFGQIEAKNQDWQAWRYFVQTVEANLAANPGIGRGRRTASMAIGVANNNLIFARGGNDNLGPTFLQQGPGTGTQDDLRTFLQKYGPLRAQAAADAKYLALFPQGPDLDSVVLHTLFLLGESIPFNQLDDFRDTEVFQKIKATVGANPANTWVIAGADDAQQIANDIVAGNPQPNNFTHVILHSGSKPGVPQPIADVLPALRDIFSGMNHAQRVRAMIQSRFAEFVPKEDVGSKRTVRGSNATWDSRSSKRGKGAQGVMDFAAAGEDEAIGAPHRAVPTQGGGNPNHLNDDQTVGRFLDDNMFLTHNLRVNEDAHGFQVGGKIEAFAKFLATLSNTQQPIARTLFFAPIKANVFRTCHRNNIALPYHIMLARPHMTYDMCTCVLMKGGAETGRTFQGHSDFQLGDDVQSKIHYGNYTYYSKALVTNPKNILLARNVFATGYVRGDDTKWAVVKGAADGNPMGEIESGSMFAFIVPANQHKAPNPLRIFSDDTDAYGNKFGRSMVGSQFYAQKYGFGQVASAEDFETIGTRNDSNDICYQGHQFWWKPHRENAAGGGTAGSYTGVTHNTGHWGPKVYAGCGRVRNGEEVYLKDVNYGSEVY